MKILVIGGTGLISAAITRFLAKRGDDVTIYNRGKRVAEIPNNVKRVVGDRNDYKVFKRQMAKIGPFDCVIDMICFLPEEAKNAVRTFKERTKQYIFCSTVDVYTKPAKRYPVTEDSEKNPSTSFSYAFNKAACERIFFEANRCSNFTLTVIRPAYTYGEGAAILHTFGRGTYFLDRIRKGKPIIVHGDGTSFWVACHRDDVARAFVGAAGNTSAFGKAYNVTSEELMTWNNYHQKVAEAMNALPPKLVHIPTDFLRKIAPKHADLCAENFQFNNIFDNNAARTDLGFTYSIPWVEGVKRVVKWLENNGGFEDSENFPFYDRIIESWQQLGENMKSQLSNIEQEYT